MEKDIILISQFLLWILKTKHVEEFIRYIFARESFLVTTSISISRAQWSSIIIKSIRASPSCELNHRSTSTNPGVSRVVSAARSCGENRGCVRWPHRRTAFHFARACIRLQSACLSVCLSPRCPRCRDRIDRRVTAAVFERTARKRGSLSSSSNRRVSDPWHSRRRE